MHRTWLKRDSSQTKTQNFTTLVTEKTQKKLQREELGFIQSIRNQSGIRHLNSTLETRRQWNIFGTQGDNFQIIIPYPAKLHSSSRAEETHADTQGFEIHGHFFWKPMENFPTKLGRGQHDSHGTGNPKQNRKGEQVNSWTVDLDHGISKSSGSHFSHKMKR